MTTELRLTIECERTPLVETALRLLRRQVDERSGVATTEVDDGPDLVLAIEPGIGVEGFRIEGDAPVRVIGNDERGLLYGIGKFLRASRYAEGEFTPGAWRGKSVPKRPVRGIYLASHFYNTYHVGPVEQTQRLIEDLALWGCNALAVWFDMHHFTGIDDPKAVEMVDRLKAFLRTATEVGMGAGLVLLGNEAYNTSPEDLRASCVGGFKVELCPSQPGAMEHMLKDRDEMFAAFGDVDIRYVIIWPYDQGGCDCEGCRPWGGNGFLRMAEPIADLARKHWPDVQRVLSTWWYDVHYDGDWEGIAAAFAEQPDWLDYIMADGQGDGFPRFPLERGVPGGLPMISFPEISMCGNYPWGGFGANPLPAYIASMWQPAADVLAGGFPYSEGVYEDTNKAISLQLFWGDRPTLDTLREYAAFEFAPEAADDVVRAAELMERGTPRAWRDGGETGGIEAVIDRPELALECVELVRRAETHMTERAKAAWRWRVFRLRAEVDAELAATGGVANETVLAYLDELTAIYSMPLGARHAPAARTIASYVVGAAHPELG